MPALEDDLFSTDHPGAPILADKLGTPMCEMLTLHSMTRFPLSKKNLSPPHAMEVREKAATWHCPVGRAGGSAKGKKVVRKSF